MRASILAILILGGVVLNIKAQFSYNERVKPSLLHHNLSAKRLLSQPGIRLYAGWGTLAF